MGSGWAAAAMCITASLQHVRGTVPHKQHQPRYTSRRIITSTQERGPTGVRGAPGKRDTCRLAGCVWGCGQPKQTTSQPKQNKNTTSRCPHAASTGAHAPPRVASTASQASADYDYDVQRGWASSSQAATLAGGLLEATRQAPQQPTRQPNPKTAPPTLPQYHSR